MKITVEQDKPVYKPITITLETAQEYFELLAALGASEDSVVQDSMVEDGVEHLIPSYCDKVGEVYSMLYAMKEQVKETL